MQVYTSTLNRSEKPLKCVKHGNFCEVVTNDEQIKIVLARHVVLDAQAEQEFYATTYFIKEGDGWIKTSTQNTYRSMEEFISALSQTDEFSQAVEDYYSYSHKKQTTL